MKVLHVITYLSDSGGAEKLLEDLLPEIKEEGIDVSVAVLVDLATRNKKILLEHGIQIISLGKGNRIYSIIKMINLIPKMRNFDIVHSHLTAPFLMCAFNKFFCKAKIVNTIHLADSRLRHIKLLSVIEKWAISRYDTIIACSGEAEKSLKVFMGNRKLNIITINNGIKLNKIYQALPVALNRKENELIIMMVALFRPQKNHETLIRATKLLPNNFKTYLIGHGELMEQMKTLAAELGIENRVIFLGQRNDVPQLLKASDFLVLSSHVEGLSLSSIEGMAAGKPFIASSVPGLIELVEGYGELFEDGNAEQLADIIKRLSENECEYNEVAMRCRNRAMSYDIKNTAEGYINVYNNLFL